MTRTLGDHIRSFPVSRTNTIGFYLMAAVFFLAGVGSAISERATFAAIIGAMLALPIAFLGWRNQRIGLHLFKDGLVWTGPKGKPQILKYDEILTVQVLARTAEVHHVASPYKEHIVLVTAQTGEQITMAGLSQALVASKMICERNPLGT